MDLTLRPKEPVLTPQPEEDSAPGQMAPAPASNPPPTIDIAKRRRPKKKGEGSIARGAIHGGSEDAGAQRTETLRAFTKGKIEATALAAAKVALSSPTRAFGFPDLPALQKTTEVLSAIRSLVGSKIPFSEDEIHIVTAVKRALREKLPARPTVYSPQAVAALPDEFLLLPPTSVDMTRAIDLTQVFPDHISAQYQSTLEVTS